MIFAQEQTDTLRKLDAGNREYVVLRDTQDAVTVHDLAGRVLTVSGVSKSHAMTGFRIGWVAGPKDLIHGINTFLSQSAGNCCSVSQAAALAALLQRARDDPDMLPRLSAQLALRAALFAPEAERATLHQLVGSLVAHRSTGHLP